ncbi:MAG: helix-turn-helix transcriptional regulator [Hyphomicrobiaceae bacterium]
MRRSLAKTPPKDIDHCVGTTIRQLREERCLSRSSVASLLKLSANEYDAFESGEKRVPAEQLYVLAQLFGKPIIFFFRDLT